MICEFCGKEDPLPFKCPYCNGYFCAEHRLPEAHSCRQLWRARKPRESMPYARPRRRSIFRRFSSPFSFTPSRAFVSSTELRHMSVGALLVMMVGLSLTGWVGPLWFLVSAAVLFFIAFFVHELAHKYSAQRLGLWAEFRVEPFGALLTAISILSPFKIIAPGAVVVSGFYDLNSMGRVALWGPLMNLILAPILILVSLATTGYTSLIFKFGGTINAYIAFFNLLPIGIFDGHKVILWNKRVWAVMFVSSLALLGFSWFFI